MGETLKTISKGEAMISGKVIQIAAAGHDNTSATQSNLTLFVLTDHGQVCMIHPHASGDWIELVGPHDPNNAGWEAVG